MALSPQQLQALFQGISSGNQAGFAGSTPDMSQDERNQWINSYGTGGKGYGDYLSWYGGQNGTSNQPGSVQPGQISQNGSFSVNPGMPYINSMTSPTGVSMTNSVDNSFAGQPKGGGAGAGPLGPGSIGPPSGNPGTRDTRDPNGGFNANQQQMNRNPNFPGLGTPGWNQFYTPGSGNGAHNPYAVGPSVMPGTPSASGPPQGGVVAPPGSGGGMGRQKMGGGFGFWGGGGGNGFGLMNGIKWR